MRRIARWTLRIVAGVVALLVLVVLGVTIAVHTGPGREMLRKQVEERLAGTFVGGAKLGGIEGNPFGEMTLHDLVINGADGRPAFSFKTLVVGVGVLPLMSHQARVLALRADGVDVDLRRNARGELVTQGLTRPGPPSAWSIGLPEVAVRNAHVRFDTGSEVMNFDDLAFDGWAQVPHGGPVDAGLDVRGTWRERRAPLSLKLALRSDAVGVTAPYLIAKAGDVSVVANQLRVRTGAPEGDALATPPRVPVIGGVVFVNASAAAVEQLVPTLHLPADFVVQVTAAPLTHSPLTAVSISGRVDQTPVSFTGTADLDTRHVRGKLEAGALDITRLSSGKVVGHAAGTVELDVRPGGPRALPVASARIRGWSELAGVPHTELDVAVRSAGERASATIHATGERVRAELAANVRAVGDAIAIESAALRATTSDPARASGGKAPVHGALQIDLRASGALRPAPSLAIAGTIEGQRLRMQDLSVAALHVAVDARQVPTRPLGKGHVQLVDLVRNNVQLGELTVDAVDRPDGKIAVAMRSRPKQNPWLIDADAVVTPPADLGKGRVAVDIVGHHVRAGSGSDWYGNTGHIDIGPERISLRDLTSKSQVGSLAVTGSFTRAGRHSGDLAANLEVASLTLDNLTGALAGTYHGKVNAKVAVTRTDGAWQGNVDLDGRGLSFTSARASVSAVTAASPLTVASPAPAAGPVPAAKPGANGVATAAAKPRTPPTFDTQVHAGLHGRRLTVAANVASSEVGSARIALDAEAPSAAEAPAAWQRLGRNAIRTAELTLRGVDVRRAAELAGLPGEYAGKIDGGIQLTGTTTAGRIEVRDLAAPALRGLAVTAALELSQRSPREITPRLTVTADGAGNATAQAELAMPERPFDAAAWRRLGRGALHSASVRSEGITIDPGLLDRLGVTSQLRGRAGFEIDIGEAARTAQAAIDLRQLRGGALDQPIDVHATASLDERTTTTALTVASKGAPLIQLTGRVPVSLAEMIDRRSDPAAIQAIPLSATAKLTQTEATRLFAVVGRTEITGGRIDGTVQLSGTVGKPQVTARLAATQLTIPPGPRGKPVRVVEKMDITASWDGTTARLDVTGNESAGGTLKLAGVVRPDRLADGTLTIQASKFDIVPILVFAPGPAGGSAGELDANLRLTGLDLRTAQIAGEVHLRDARIPTSPTVGTLRSAKIDAVVADHEIRVAVDGKLGAGRATLTGSIALDGAAPNGGKATLKLDKISPIGSVEPQITADVNATLSRDRNQWHAELVVDNGRVVVPKGRGEKLKPVGPPPDMMFASGERLSRRPRPEQEPTNPIFVVVIDLRSTKVESEEFRGLVRGRLELRADGQDIALYGGVEADRGDLDLFGRRYFVDRAAVHFDGSLDPLLDVRITHDFPDVITVTEVHGRASKPELVMSSDPGTYSQGQLLGFLLGGEPGGDPQSSPLQSQVAGAGESYIANQIGGYVKKALPIDIDVLRYESATSTSSAAVTVGTWINSSLFLAYRQRLESRPDENLGEGVVEYWLTRRLMIQGTAGDRNVDGADLLWRKRY